MAADLPGGFLPIGIQLKITMEYTEEEREGRVIQLLP